MLLVFFVFIPYKIIDMIIALMSYLVMEIKFYQTAVGKAPVIEFLKGLQVEDRVRISGCLENIQQLGFNSPRVNFRQIKGSLWEIKVRTNKGAYRLFYVSIKGNGIVFLHAYKNQSQKAPKKEIEIAEKRMLEVLENESTYID